MKRNKFISRMLLAGILLNNLSIISNAGILSSDERYETFIENNITVKDVLEEEKVDIKVEGNTLVNYVDYSNLFDSRNNNITINQDNKEIFFENKNNNLDGDYTDSALYFRPRLEVNKTYTIILNIIENTISGEQFFRVLDNYGDYMSASSLIITDNRAGIVKAKFTVKENNNGTFKIYLRNPNNQQNRGTIKIKNLMILEGDWTNKETPNYFEGIKSVGELKNNKLTLSLQNKNIFNGVLKKGFYDVNGGYHYDDNAICSENFIPVKPNTNYVISIEEYEKDAQIFISQYDFYNNHINQLSTKNGKFRTDKNASYIRINTHVNLSDNLTLDSKIQIEEGENPTDYISNMSTDKNIILNEPLRGLPNGINDKIIKKNGQWVIERNLKQIVLNGSDNENWVLINKQSQPNSLYFSISLNDKVASQDVLSDKFIYQSVWDKDDIEGILINYTLESIHIRILKSKLSTMDSNGFKEWLKSNPVSIIYQLENPIYEPLNTDLNINTYTETTHISNNSNIPATMEVTVDRVLNRAVEYTTLAKTNPTIENLSKARYWNNQLKDSIKKDQLQEEVNNITTLNDMELERKTVTSNIDLYIKSENILQMSLSTNSITFEDFSGVEDMIKENAVIVSVNSSLPYQLNACLPVEIQNSDKSNTMDKQILNLKENSESNYQTFASITDKVVLKDNCPAGNNLIHGVDIKLSGGIAHEKDVYKTTIKFEVEQK